MDNTSKTQKSIVRAARKAFLQHGYGGARMQEIADQAKVNKALLHYHFRNKEKLFRTVLNQEARRVARPFAILSSGEVPYPEKLRQFTAGLQALALRDPDCLPFVLQSARQYPEYLDPPLAEQLNLTPFLEQVRTGMSHGFIPGSDAASLTIRLLALALVMPLAGDLLASLLGTEACDQFRQSLPDDIGKLLNTG
jgi:TetR/AcrR family transcriptional regulator